MLRCWRSFSTIEGFAAAEDAGEIGVIVGRAKQDGSGADRRDDDAGAAGGNFPEGGGALLLNFGVRREILEWQNVAGREGDDGVGIDGAGEFGEGGDDGQKVFGGAIVGDDDDERALGAALEENSDEGFGGGVEARDTNPPRALAQMGGRTPEGWEKFHLRENFADKREEHVELILSREEAEVESQKAEGRSKNAGATRGGAAG